LYSIHLQKGGSSKNYGIDTSYNHGRFCANLSHTRADGTTNSNRTQVGFESTLFFADGEFAVGRSSLCEEGFVIVVPKKKLAETDIKFLDSLSESGFLGGAVLTVPRNVVYSHRLNVKELPDNIAVDRDAIIQKGSYRRGAVMEIEAEGDFIARGTLVDSAGKAIDLAGGYAVNVSDKNATPVQFFTNSSGEFVICNLKAGKYNASINIEGYSDFEINVVESKNNIIELGTVVCKDIGE
jgi:hypothetical protein